MSENEDAIINNAMRAIQPQYPSLTIEELRQIFDETYERLSAAEPSHVLDSERNKNAG